MLVPTGAQAAAVNVAVWHMDDAGATMSDASGRQHTGSLRNVDVRQPGASGTAFGFKTKRPVVTVPSAGDTLLIGAKSTSGGDHCTGLMDEVVLRAG